MAPGASGQAAKRYLNHHTWDGDWEEACNTASDKRCDASEVIEKFLPKLKATVKLSLQQYVESQVLLGRTPTEAAAAYNDLTRGMECPETVVSEPIKFHGEGSSRKVVFPGEALYSTASSIFERVAMEEVLGEGRSL